MRMSQRGMPAAISVVDALIAESEAAGEEGRLDAAVAAAERAVAAAEHTGDSGLLIRALDQERRSRRSHGDYAGTLAVATRILASAEAPGADGELSGEVADRAIANAYLEIAHSGRLHGLTPARELLKVLDAADLWLTAAGHQDWRAAVIIERAELYRALGDIDAALGLAQEAVAVYHPRVPGFSGASYLNCLGILLGLAGRPDEAAAQFQAIADDSRAHVIDRAVAHKQLAEAAHAAGRGSEAARYAETAAALATGCGNPMAASALGVLARVRLGTGNLEGARDAAERGLAAARRSGELSSCYYAAKVAADIALDSGDLTAARQLVTRLGEHAHALDAAQGGSAFGAEVAARRRRLASCAGRMYWDGGRYHAAVACFTAVLAAEPGLSWALAARGITYRLMGRHQDAIADLNAAVEADPGYALATANRGEVLRLERDHQAALADLGDAVRLLPGYAWAIGSRGQVYQALGRTAEALADFELALDLDPDLGWVVAARDAITGASAAS